MATLSSPPPPPKLIPAKEAKPPYWPASLDKPEAPEEEAGANKAVDLYSSGTDKA